MEVVFWWNIPCKGMINVLKCYALSVDKTSIVVTGSLSQSRKNMGWKDCGKLFDQHIILSDNEWDIEGKKIINRYNKRLHIFNGITYTPRMKRLIEYAILNNVAFCNMSEAYFNLERGWRRIAKDFYLNLILPFETKKIASKSRGIICLSGGNMRDKKQFKRLGFSEFYPFGYFTDEINGHNYVQNDDGKVHILCPGLLEHYKGVDILIAALFLLKQKGIHQFVCHITGNGSEKKRLMKQSHRLGLNDLVVFEGVLDADTFQTLLMKIDILVAPGRVEPWGIRINEAIQRGNIVVVSDGIGANFLIKESGGGAVFKSGSSKDLANKLQPFLENRDCLSNIKKKNIDYKDKISCIAQAKCLNEYIKIITHKKV